MQKKKNGNSHVPDHIQTILSKLKSIKYLGSGKHQPSVLPTTIENHRAPFSLSGALMDKLRETGVVKQITQFNLRMTAAIHQSKISMIEDGLIEPREDEKKRLARALGVRPEEIWSEPTTKGGERNGGTDHR